MYQPSAFIPTNLVIKNWDDLKPFFDKLSSQKIQSNQDLEDLILHYSEVISMFSEQYARAYINMTCHTDKQDFVRTYETFSSEISPKVEVASNELQKKISNSDFFADLPAARYTQLKQSLKRDLEMFHAENVPLDAELSKLVSEYEQLAGSIVVTVDNEEITLPKAGVFLESNNRNERQKYWSAIQQARYSRKAEHDELLNKMIQLRHKVSQNAGYSNFRDYQHDHMHRFDYTVSDVLKFHDAIEKHVTPLVKNITKNHMQKLGLTTVDYRPWDSTGKPITEKPLKPFQTVNDLLNHTIDIFTEIKPEFGANLKTMRSNSMFDLESRKAKAPGGYNYGLQVTGMPFIFMNAAGTHRDVVTLMHEGGHAMHTFLTNSEPLIQYRNTPSEMAETASMSMELLSSSHWNRFYSDDDLKRARREHLEGTIDVFPWVATVDCFQHWLYTNPEHSASERDLAFEKIFDRFGTGLVNWSGFENIKRNLWQKQLHIFSVPFYYIEYAIAQIGALQIYRNYRKDPKQGIHDYVTGLSLGSSRPLPEVWRAMNIKFDFSEQTIRDLMLFVGEELASL